MGESPGTTHMYDVAVVGGGPAGVSAAINVRNRGRGVVLLAGRAPFGRVNGPHEIANYAGFPITTGDDLVGAFRRHLEAFEVPVVEDKVTRIVRAGEGAAGDGFALFGAAVVYSARSVVLATGVDLEASIEGEEDLVGQGVSYCVTCDGRLFAGRRLAFISYGAPGEEEASELADAFGADVTYLPQYEGDYQLSGEAQVRAGARPLRLSREDDGVHILLGGGRGRCEAGRASTRRRRGVRLPGGRRAARAPRRPRRRRPPPGRGPVHGDVGAWGVRRRRLRRWAVPGGQGRRSGAGRRTLGRAPAARAGRPGCGRFRRARRPG